MGVPGLWEILKGTEDSKSLTSLAWNQYFTAKDFKKRMRIGIDVSIWLFQATSVAQPEVHNHALLILFFKLSHLAGLPVQCLFVFDGPGRPDFKRGKTINTSSRSGRGLEKSFKTMIELFGFESWEAPGEAEAELGYLNHIGSLDAIITEDVDALLFKAKTVLVKPEKSARSENRRYNVFRSEEITKKYENVDSDGLVLVALLSGGDYDQEGLFGCGPKIAIQLACERYGSSLANAYRTMSTESFKSTFLPTFRADISNYLRTDPHGSLGRKMTKLAKELENTPDFPDIRVLESYINPLTSGSDDVEVKWKGFEETAGLRLGELGAFASKAFGWTKEDVTKRFESVLADKWLGEVLLKELIDPGARSRRCENVASVSSTVSPPAGSSGPQESFQDRLETVSEFPILSKITTYRKHGSTDELLEYRCLMEPAQFFHEIKIGIRDLPEPPPKSPTKKRTLTNSADQDGTPSSRSISALDDISTPFLVWLPYKLVRHTHPNLVRSFNEREEEKISGRQEKERRAAGRKATSTVSSTDTVSSDFASEEDSPRDDSHDKGISSPSKSTSVSKYITDVPDKSEKHRAPPSTPTRNGRIHFSSFLSPPSSSLPSTIASLSALHLSREKSQDNFTPALSYPVQSSTKKGSVTAEKPSQFTSQIDSPVKKAMSTIYSEIDSPSFSTPKKSVRKTPNSGPSSRLPSKPSAFPIQLTQPKSTTSAFESLASDLLSSLPSTTPSTLSASFQNQPLVLQSPSLELSTSMEPRKRTNPPRTNTRSAIEVVEISDSDESDDESGLSYETKLRKQVVGSNRGANLQSVFPDRLDSRRMQMEKQTIPPKYAEPRVPLSSRMNSLNATNEVIELLDSSDEE